MKVQIRDRAPFEALNPTELAAYLQSTGWRQVEYKPEHSAVWSKDCDGEALEILLPLRRSLGDYVLRMADAVATLASVENRSQLEILSDLQMAGSDVIRVRLRHADALDGSVSLDRGEALVENSREMMLAGACAAVNRRAYYAASKPNDARKFMQSLRLGQTERGSYVLTILSRVNPQLQPVQGALFEEPDPPFERKAVLRLSQALAALRTAAADAMATFRAEAFEEVVADGVSANLCSALVNMNGQAAQPADELRISFTWARSRPAGPDQIREVVFPGDHFPVIAEAGRLLRRNAPPEESEIQGYVVKLQAKGDGGIATVATFIDGQPRKVTVNLADTEHKKAIQAYEQRTEIVCSGALTKSGQLWSLQRPGHVVILNDEAPTEGSAS